MKLTRDKELTKRFYFLNAAVSVLLLAVIVLSVFKFGADTFEGKRTIGIVLPDKATDAGWNKSHSDGIKKACKDLNCNLVIAEDVKSNKIALNEAMERLIKKRAQTVFFAGSENLDEVFDVITKHPNIVSYGVEFEKTHVPMRKYFVRYAEAYYLAGIVAGLRTSTGKIGFIAPHASPSINQMVNAFALGAKRIKPDIKVILVWTGSLKSPVHEEQAVRDMRAHNADVIAYFSDGSTIVDAASRARIDFISLFQSNESAHNIATISVNWDNIYKTLLRHEAQSGDFTYTASVMDRGVEVIVNRELNERGKAIFEAEVFEIKEGRSVFTGPILDNRGNLKAKENEIISEGNLNRMNYLVEGVMSLGN